jgi:hypothetical protein
MLELMTFLFERQVNRMIPCCSCRKLERQRFGLPQDSSKKDLRPLFDADLQHVSGGATDGAPHIEVW